MIARSSVFRQDFDQASGYPDLEHLKNKNIESEYLLIKLHFGIELIGVAPYLAGASLAHRRVFGQNNRAYAKNRIAVLLAETDSFYKNMIIVGNFW